MFEKLNLEIIGYPYLLTQLNKEKLDYTLKIFEEVTKFTHNKEENRELLAEFKNFYESKLNDEKILEEDKEILKKIFEKQYQNLEKIVILSSIKEIARYVLKNITDILTLKSFSKLGDNYVKK